MSALGGQPMADYGWAYGEQTRRLVAFSLDGTQPLPVNPPPRVPQPLASSDFIVDGDLASRGALYYGQSCNACHGGGAISAGMTPDLRASAVVLSQEAFRQVVREGALQANGMPPFTDFSDEKLEQIRHFIRAQAEIGLAQ